MLSSHLILGLPIALLVLYFELSSGFHSAAFIHHLSLGDIAVLSANHHFIFFASLVPASNLRLFQIFHGFVCASFNPVFFFSHCCVNFLVGIVLK